MRITMRITKNISISLAPEQVRIAERLAKKQNRTMSELFREGLRKLEQEDRRGVNGELLAALRAVQEDARRGGLDKMTAREINVEVAATRREQRAKTAKPPKK
jgi:Arc/MetJ-type ribon-helix-helix transcriptional regulator